MTDPRTIAVLTTGRQDYGLLRSSLMLLEADPQFRLHLWVGGMHLKDRFGRTIRLIENDGLPIAREFDFLKDPPSPTEDAAEAMVQVSGALAEDRPDAVLLVGDRSETLAAGLAAAMSGTPIVHLHGGEESQGAVDNVCRHALTKMAHLHLVSHEVHARRVLQMGEDPHNVVVVGAPGLDNIYRSDLPGRAAIERDLESSLEPPLVIVTVHPATLGTDPAAEVRAVATAMEEVPATYVVTQPNADAGGAVIRGFWNRWAQGRRGVAVVDALGERHYWGLLLLADAVLGNSSSGIIEAPTAGVPAVNVGERQRGRLRHPGTRDVPTDAAAISGALRWAVTPEAKVQVGAVPSPYPAGAAAPRILQALGSWHPPAPPTKRFRDIAWTEHR